MSLLNEYSALVIAAVLILASVPIVFAFGRARISIISRARWSPSGSA
jgi:hypothetical protein